MMMVIGEGDPIRRRLMRSRWWCSPRSVGGEKEEELLMVLRWSVVRMMVRFLVVLAMVIAKSNWY